MISGYVSSDEEDYDDFYSDPPVKRNEVRNLPPIETKQIREEFLFLVEHNKKIELFLKAAEESDLNTLEKLISLGVEVDSSLPSKWTALMIACSSGNSVTAQFLLEHGANPNLSRELITPLMVCCIDSYISESNKLECVRLLLQYNAQVNDKDKYEATALMLAAGNGYTRIVDEFLQICNLDINLQDNDGSSALFYAVNKNKCEIVQKLVDAGIDLTLKNRYERTALDIALLKNFEEVAAILGYIDENKFMKYEALKDSVSKILDALPAPCGSGGFSCDVQDILKSLLPFKKTEEDKEKKVSLPEFLNFNENDLCDIGIPFQCDRLKVLKYTIHEYHLCPWKKSSMPQFPQDNVTIEDAISITSNLMKHLTIANASLKYMSTRISSRVNSTLEELHLEKELVTILINSYSVIKLLKKTLKQILEHANEIEVCVPDDFVVGHSKCGRSDSVISKKKLWFVAGTAITAFLICHLKASYKKL